MDRESYEAFRKINGIKFRNNLTFVFQNSIIFKKNNSDFKFIFSYYDTIEKDCDFILSRERCIRLVKHNILEKFLTRIDNRVKKRNREIPSIELLTLNNILQIK